MPKLANRGEVWLVDLGMIAKVRPCLILSIPADADTDRVLTTIVPHTTSTRESRFEVVSRVRFLKAGAWELYRVTNWPKWNWPSSAGWGLCKVNLAQTSATALSEKSATFR